ncbi:hypothetical protein SAY87_007952 [Trapa incisa]|uniref:Uncharacterized protein n=1 Tax=Trapa incisa TaxID=236973 RepID=A0AAN7QIT7_9MYRT|nr:hypothetical protein SAY87_007952 [Trapa incisa]
MAKDFHAAGSGEFRSTRHQRRYWMPRSSPKWSFYRAIIAEFVTTLLFLYVTVLTVIGYKS